MKHRNKPQQERYARSRLAKLVHDYPFIKGSVVVMKNTCGKPGCKCARGQSPSPITYQFVIGEKER